MLEIFEIKSSIKNYIVSIEKDSILSIIKDRSYFVMIDSIVSDRWPSLNLNNFVRVVAEEDKKNLNMVSELIENLKNHGATRGSKILSIGGGITQDLTTFCASSYMRGISWVYAPTTLLGMVDSCIGGKSSLNVGKYKNIAGNYYPPDKVIIDINFCKTLSNQQLIEGLFEAVKICYVYSDESFKRHISYFDSSKDLHSLNFEKIVFNSLISKKAIIEEDEFDKGRRLLLNFGHTFGHAIEGASNFKISHGVAVALGMVAAFHLSVQLNLIMKDNIKASALLTHLHTLLDKVEGLIELTSSIDMKVAFNNFKSDKKHSKELFVVILFDNDGAPLRHQLNRNVVNDLLIINSFNYLKREKDEI